MIPRRIIQTGKTSIQSLRNRAAMANLRLLHPAYEYMFFDDAAVEAFVGSEFPQYRWTFNSFMFPIQRYDFFRYLAVYRYGGFYFDLDVLLGCPLDSLLHNDCVFSFESLTVSTFLRDDLGMDWMLGNYAFGAEAGHPFIRAVIENCVKAQENPSWVKSIMRGSPPLLGSEFYILNSSGPGIVSRTLAENKDLAKTVTVLFPEDVCDVANCWNRFGDFGVHLADSSWRPRHKFIRRKLADFGWRWIQGRRVQQAKTLGRHRTGGAEPRDKFLAASS